MRYYIADLHFFHANMNTKMDHRGFGSVEEMNEYMMQNSITKRVNSSIHFYNEVYAAFCYTLEL